LLRKSLISLFIVPFRLFLVWWSIISASIELYLKCLLIIEKMILWHFHNRIFYKQIAQKANKEIVISVQMRLTILYGYFLTSLDWSEWQIRFLRSIKNLEKKQSALSLIFLKMKQWDFYHWLLFFILKILFLKIQEKKTNENNSLLLTIIDGIRNTRRITNNYITKLRYENLNCWFFSW
jgi:hypothetical protein